MSQAELADDFLPIYDVSDAVATVADADPEAAWRALLDVDLLELGREAPFVGMLGALRMLPCTRAAGSCSASARARRSRSGSSAKFWRPVIEFARIASADEFREFDEPGFAKTVYDLPLRQLDANRTLLSGLMRTATTDEHARRWFRRY